MMQDYVMVSHGTTVANTSRYEKHNVLALFRQFWLPWAGQREEGWEVISCFISSSVMIMILSCV